MNAFDYNIGIVSKYARENFWNKVDKSLPISEKRKLYEQFFAENSQMISESVDELLKNRNSRMVVNEGFFDDVDDENIGNNSLENDIPDDDDDDMKGVKSMHDFEVRQNQKENASKSKSLSDEQADWLSHQEITLKNRGDKAYIQGDKRDINYAADLVYDMLLKGELEGMTTQDVELPYSIFNVTDVKNFCAVFAFKDLPNVDLSGWNVSNGTVFDGMFYKSTFNNDSIREWELSSAESVKNMFVASDFDKQEVIDHWEATINPFLGYMPVIGQMSVDDAEISRKQMSAMVGNAQDVKRKVKTLKSYRNTGIMDTDEQKTYVMDTAKFIQENYVMNEGVIGDYAKKAFDKIKGAFKSVGIKLMDGFTFVVGKTFDMFGANLPQNIVNFIHKHKIRGVYAEIGKPVNYPSKSGYYDKIEKGSLEYDNYLKFLDYVSKAAGISESVEVNERRVGLKAIEKEGGQTYLNIDAVDVTTSELENDLNDNINEILMDGRPTGKPMLVWGAPGIGKTTIPSILIKAANKKIAESGGSTGNMMSIIVVDCSTLQAGDLFMPMPVKINDIDIERVKQNPVIQEMVKGRNMTDKDFKKYISAHSSDAPKSWLPMWQPTGDREIDKARNAEANGSVDIVYDKDGIEMDSEVHGGGGILMFDEFLRADPDTLFGIAQIMMNRQTTSGYRLGSKWYCMACSNRPTDDIQVNQNWQLLSDALKQRFVSVNFVPDFKEWAKWAKEKGGFDDFTIDHIGAMGADTKNSRWHNIDPTESTTGNKTRQISPRSWSFCIEELNRVCRLRGLKSYTELGEKEFKRIVKKFLPDKTAEEYVEDYMDNQGNGVFKYKYEDIVANPTMRVEDTKSVVMTNYLKRYIMRHYNVKNPISPHELENLIKFLEINYDNKGGNTSSDFIARVFKYCDLTGVNYTKGDEKSEQYIAIWRNYQKNHPDIDLKGLYDSIPKSMI
jgi:MoxR-like ATPase